MIPKDTVEIEPFIIADCDRITCRNNFSDILKQRVNNSDVVKVLENNLKINERKQSLIEADIIAEDVELLNDTLALSINKYMKSAVADNLKSHSTKETGSEGTFTSVKRLCSVNINDLYSTQEINKKLNILRYRENVFKAASRLTKESPHYPNWAFKDSNKVLIKTKKINVGGRIFELFENTFSNLKNTKLNNCLRNHKFDEMIFIDRDPVCFNAILNFYRTGKLHIPPNVCLTFFEEELLFWGINEEFMEPCCWSEYKTFKEASNKLRMYTEDSEQKKSFTTNQRDDQNKFKQMFYRIMVSGGNSKISRFISLICGTLIIIGILSMIVATTPLGRTDENSKSMAVYHENESVLDFLNRTVINTNVANLEIFISGYFVFDILSRMYFCSDKLQFFSDSLTWIDIVSTFTSVVGSTQIIQMGEGHIEAYIFLLKLPRILRLFRLTGSLRSGISAFTLTITVCLEELKLVFLIVLTLTITFGVLIFFVEIEGFQNQISTIFIGMWWSIVSMSGVGYGDYIPKTSLGFIIGSLCIMVGVVICQMPVPIFLKNFSIYYNQASARLISQSNLLMCENVNKSEIRDIEYDIIKDNEFKSENAKSKLEKFFYYLKGY